MFLINTGPINLTPLNKTTTAHSATSDALPAYLTPYTDPTYGSILTRVSDSGETVLSTTWNTISHHQYSQIQAWSADETMLYIETGAADSSALFLDGQTYEPLFTRSTTWVEARWHPAIDDMMYYTTGTALRSMVPSTGTTALIKDFSGTYSTMKFGQFEGNPSNNGDIWPFTATRASDSHKVCLIYKVSTDTMLGVIDVDGLTKTMDDGKITISPLGDYANLYFDDETQGVFTAAGSQVYITTGTEVPSHNDPILYQGVQYICGSHSSDGGEIMRRLFTSDSTTDISSYTSSWCYHTSARNYRAGDWVVSTYHQDSGSPYVGEIVAIKLDGTAGYRICHHRSTGTDYDHEPHASSSPSGKRVIFASDWGGGDLGDVHVFVADFRHFSLP